MKGLEGKCDRPMLRHSNRHLRSTFTFWRFPIQIQLGDSEICIKYRINGGIQLSFFVPARHQNMRWATYSVRSTQPARCIFCPLLLV